jgi:hypothetical protein
VASVKAVNTLLRWASLELLRNAGECGKRCSKRQHVCAPNITTFSQLFPTYSRRESDRRYYKVKSCSLEPSIEAFCFGHCATIC